MMARKFLHELLKEDQEPFHLNKYISDRQSQMRRPSFKTSLQPKKRKSMIQNSNFPGNLCKNACLFSFTDTPDLRKSPLFEFASPIKSPCKSPNAIFLQIPSRTAALLLEAALRIQKQSSAAPSSKTKTKTKGLGSLFKRLTQRNQNIKKEIECGNGSSKDLETKMDSHMDDNNNNNNNIMNMVSEVGFRCSYNGRSSSTVWSESNEDKSLDMGTSSSSNSDYSEGIHFVTNQEECVCCSHVFCESPFRFVLQTSPSSSHQTPELMSPSRRITEDTESNGGAENLKKCEAGEEEEDKEQCSPVSVLDPPFEDDEEGHGNDDDGFDLESSYAIVQRAKQQLLYKLRRFEKLAELDPVELERRMLDQEEDEDETFVEEDDHEDEDNEASYKEKDFRELVLEAVCQLWLNNKQQIPKGIKTLISDLIVEEERELSSLEDRDMVIKQICKRLELWKEVESNTIDMMIEEDFSRESDGWKNNVEQVRKMAGELELSIFGFLVEEFSEELVC